MGRRVALTSVLAVALLGCGLLFGDDTKSAAKGRLPKYFAKLGLSAEQKDKALSITAEYGAKIDDLKKQITKLEKEERAELYKVLSDDQKQQLKKILASKAGEGDSKDEKKPPSDK